MDDIGSGITAGIMKDGRIEFLFSNDRFYEMHGYTRRQYNEEVTDNYALIHPEDRSQARQAAFNAYSTQTPTQIEYRLICKGGEERWVRVGISSTRFTGVKQTVQLCIYTDVTDEKEAELELKDTSALLHTLMDDMPGGFVRIRVNPDGSVMPVFFNEGFCKLTGMNYDATMKLYSEDSLAGVHPDDMAIIGETIGKMITNGEIHNARYRLRHSDDSYSWFNVFGRMTRDRFDNKFLNVYYTDATNQVVEEEKQKSLLDNLPHGVALYEYDGKELSLVHLNKRYWELVGREPGEFNKDSFMDAVHPNDRVVISGEISAAVRQKRDVSCDIRIRYGESGYRPFHGAGRIIPKEDGTYSIYASYTPISDESMSYQQMLPVVLSTIMESTSDLSFAKDMDYRYICSSRAFADLAGCSSGNEVIGKTDYDLFDKATADRYRRDDEALLKNGTSLVDMVEEIPSTDGIPHYSSTSKYLLRDAAGDMIGLYGVGRDITKYRDAFGKLKLLTDTLPGGIATYECTRDSIKLIYFNDGFCRLFGMEREEYEKIASENPLARVYDEDKAILQGQINVLLEDGTPLECGYRVHTSDGGYKWISQRAVAADVKGNKVIVNAILQDVTSQRELTERLRLSEAENMLAIQLGGNIICRFTVVDRTLRLSHDTAANLALPEIATDVPYEPVRTGMISPESVAAYTKFFEDIINGCRTGEVIFQQRYHKGKGWRWLEAKSATVFSDSGEPVKAVITFLNVTERLEKEAVYKKWQQSLEEKRLESYTLFRCNLSKDASFDTMEGTLLNASFTSGELDFEGRTKEYAEQYVFEEDREKYIVFLNSDAMLAGYYRGKRSDKLEYRETLPEGGVRWLRLTVDLVEYPNSTDVEAYLMYENITDSKQTELQTKELAETDPLTGVLNRAAFSAGVVRMIKDSRQDASHALLMLDIDGFKQVNDVFGHTAGDQALIYIADALRSVLRRGDLLGRLGGDEFLVFLNDIPDDVAAAKKAEQICVLARKSFSLEVQISGSVGIAIAPRDGMDFETLYKKADAALYHVKGSGKDNYTFYRDSMEDEHLAPETDAADNVEMKKTEKKRRMLIVDDSMMDHKLLANIFKDDFIVEKAKDGNTALIRLRHYGSAISVVLLDLFMPGMNGFEVLENMRSSAKLQSIPVIVVSSDESRETCLKAVRVGATDFITKPVDPDLLRIRVNSAISNAENERLRAKNSYLEMQNEERLRYETALESIGISVIEYDWICSTFVYYPSISKYIAGTYDDRRLWRILLSDMVTDTMTVQRMQGLVHNIAQDRMRIEGSITVKLKTPQKVEHHFRMNVRKLMDEYQLTNKLIITLIDIDESDKS